MTERWTDRKVGFTGNVPPGASNMAFKGSQKDPGLSVFTVAQRQSDGSMALSRNHGMYSKVTYNPVIDEAVAPLYKEYLLMYQGGSDFDNPPYPEIYNVSVFELQRDSYKLIYDIDLSLLFEAGLLLYDFPRVYWKDGKIVFPEDFNGEVKLWELTPRKGADGVAAIAQLSDLTLKVIYDEDPDDAYYYPILYASSAVVSGELKTVMAMYYYDLYSDASPAYLVPFSNYSFNGTNVVVEYNEAGNLIKTPISFKTIGESFVSTAKVMYLTPDNVRILRDESAVPYLRTICDADGKIAYVLRGGNGAFPNTFELRLCTQKWKDVATVNEGGKKITSPSYLDSYTKIAESRVIASAAGDYCTPLALGYITDYDPAYGAMEPLIITAPSDDWAPDVYTKIQYRYVNWTPGNYVTYRTWYYPLNEFTEEEINETAEIQSFSSPIQVGGHIVFTDPLGIDHDFVVPPYDENGNPTKPVQKAWICWTKTHWDSANVTEFFDVAFVNGKGAGNGLFVVRGEEEFIAYGWDTNIEKVMVYDETGNYLYDLPRKGTHPAMVDYVAISKAIIKV